MRLIDEEGLIAQALIELVYRTTDLKVPEDIRPQDLNGILQEKWYRSGMFRYQIKGPPPAGVEIDILRQLGCIDEVPPPTIVCNVFDEALVLGSTLQRVWARLEYLASKWQHGAYSRAICLLGSLRPLDPDLESPQAFTSLLGFSPRSHPKTESGMMDTLRRAWSPTFTDVGEWRSISVPDVQTTNGTRPANTGETIRCWYEILDENLRLIRGNFLIVSSQPFVWFQEIIAKQVMAEYPEMHFFGIGPAADPSLPLAVYLDNLAKQFYTELALQNKGTAK